ncbi:MAG: GNAT family N-acetyltransferase [Gammaproteobacteria bacterium]|jgi:predicted GNAT family N-acyltransferase
MSAWRSGCSVSIVEWADRGQLLGEIREQVFIIEQGVPPELEWDGRDEESIHALALTTSGQPVGTARLLPEGQIGRMAVLRAWRRQGVGTLLLHCLIDCAEDPARLFLNAQTSAEPFYRRNGFVPEGEVFMEAGIPHIRMVYRIR